MLANSEKLLLDSNLLLLLMAGTFEPRTLVSFKRLSAFTADDLRQLQYFVSDRQLVVTPHLLTEVSNLATSLPERVQQAFRSYLSRTIQTCEEQFSPSATLATEHAFARFGITDTAICVLAGKTIVMTEDGRLRAYMMRRGLPVISLSDIRR